MGLDARMERLLIESDAIDGDLAGRLQRLRDDGELSDADLQQMKQLLDDGAMEDGDVRAFVKLLSDRDSNPLVDDSVTATDLFKIVEKEGNLGQTVVITKPNNVFEFDKSNGQTPETAWLETGGENEGWTHIKQRHITDEQIDEQPRTSYFPVNQEINGRVIEGPLDDNMDVQELIHNAVKEGEPSQGTRRNLAEYSYSPDAESTGIEDMTVRVNANGRITAAFPEEGPDVGVWIKNENSWLKDL